MAILPIREWGDPVLREPARAVDRFDRALARLADDMLETMYAAPGVGLAAPQVGRPIRLVVFDDGSGPRRMVNPELLALDGDQDGEEGCLSIPGLYFPLRRALRARARGFDVDGSALAVEGEGLLARILQHEIDHINGILFIDRLSRDHRKEAMRQIRGREFGVARRAHRPPGEQR